MKRVIEPIAIFQSPFKTKFGIPRQSGLAASVQGRIVFQPEYRHEEAVRGIEGFDYLWLLWGFTNGGRSSALVSTKRSDWKKEQGAGSKRTSDIQSLKSGNQSLTVRPPRLGGNERIGVFASRSPFRPNGIGLSSVRLIGIDNGELIVGGADLMDGTPIYDIKPYIAYTDSHQDARGGFTDTREWQRLEVQMDDNDFPTLSKEQQKALREALALDPRPHYHDDPSRIYGMDFGGLDVKFRVEGTILKVLKAGCALMDNE